MKINIQLYGGKGVFGGRETPLEADIISCDYADTCSFYKNKQCLNCRSFLAPICKFGSVNTIKGYTSRACKYNEFRAKYKNDELYGKLSYPSNTLVGIMNNHVYMNLKYVAVSKYDPNIYYNWGGKIVDNYRITDPGFGTKEIVIPIEHLTMDLLYSILKFTPSAMMGGEIVEYQEKVVPDILIGLKKLLPNLYNKLINKYPEFDKEPNYIGKEAQLNTLNGDIDINIGNNIWHLSKDKKAISAENFDIYTALPWWLKGGSTVAKQVVLDVNDKMTVQITDNSHVNERTVFI